MPPTLVDFPLPPLPVRPLPAEAALVEHAFQAWCLDPDLSIASLAASAPELWRRAPSAKKLLDGLVQYLWAVLALDRASDSAHLLDVADDLMAQARDDLASVASPLAAAVAKFIEGYRAGTSRRPLERPAPEQLDPAAPLPSRLRLRVPHGATTIVNKFLGAPAAPSVSVTADGPASGKLACHVCGRSDRRRFIGDSLRPVCGGCVADAARDLVTHPPDRASPPASSSDKRCDVCGRDASGTRMGKTACGSLLCAICVNEFVTAGCQN